MSGTWDPEGHEIGALTAGLTRGATGLTLEIGCGDGRLAARLAAAGLRAFGVDPSLGRVIRGAQDAGLGGALAAGDALRLPFGDSSFDRVIFGWSL